MYLSANDKGNFRALLDNWKKEPEIIVATDGGRILGLGDLVSESASVHFCVHFVVTFAWPLPFM